jgi:hypothetical protein
MKVIGKAAGGTYIVEITHTEVEKVFDKYYGNLKPLEVGATLDLGAGYDFRSEIRSACQGVIAADKQFSDARASLFRFAMMVSELPEPVVDVEAAA